MTPVNSLVRTPAPAGPESSAAPTDSSAPSIAYFTMEIGLETDIPTYSGGLGVLSGDTIRAAADMGAPMVAVSLLHRKGYFHQRLDAAGVQSEEAVEWSPEDRLEALEPRFLVSVEGRDVELRAWRYRVVGNSGREVPVYLLDSDLPENAPEDRLLTDHLYGGDSRYRLIQEVVLGMGGVALLRALGHCNIQTFHMNEGHSALLALALLEKEMEDGTGAIRDGGIDEAVAAVREKCVFTTHTPVAAGHDRFTAELVESVLGGERVAALAGRGLAPNGTLNMTHLALYFSRFVNGVAMRHAQVSRAMFPGHVVHPITNGVHIPTWASDPFLALFDEHIPEWRHEVMNLRHAIGIPLEEIRMAHETAKRRLLTEVEKRVGVQLDPSVLTIGFARRATQYKRADFVFSDLDRLRRIAGEAGPIQVIYAGKAHPADNEGKAMICRVFEAATALGRSLSVIYLENYDMAAGRDLCAGVDLWLNTPRKPQEASGTSGMKAAVNGVPSFSVLDGWWVEGHVEGVTGWSIGDDWHVEMAPADEVESLYDKLEREILPCFYGDPVRWSEIMRQSIALNGSFFNAQRMMLQYLKTAYRVDAIL
jgi:glycogen phosphorylase